MNNKIDGKLKQPVQTYPVFGREEGCIQTKPQRIMIMGRSGSGKSTFSIKLQNILNIPLFHLDKYFFTTRWQQRDYHSMIKFLNFTGQIFSVTRSYVRFARSFAVENMDVAQRTTGFCPEFYQIS